ncbi:hypothetical protein MKL29_06810 [Streptococcus suis]|nr:hypothetical protein [Streptococcus suis]
MIEELTLSPLGYLILLLVLVVLFYFIVTAESKIDPTEDVTETENQPPAYLSRYGAVIQMQGRE